MPDELNLDEPAPRRTEVVSSAPVHDEAERGVIAACLLDQEVVDRARVLTGDNFQIPENRVIFQHIIDLHSRRLPVETATLFQSLKSQDRLTKAGGQKYIFGIEADAPTTALANQHIETLRHRTALRRMVDLSRKAIDAAEGANGEAPNVISEFQRQAAAIEVGSSTSPRVVGTPITDFSYPEGDDPNCLIGNDGYLSRGGGMLLVSYAGVGKSSLIMNACMTWALGRPWFGIRCARPLKSLIIQAEDSDRYIGKIHTSFAHRNQLSIPETQQLTDNCIIARLKGYIGKAFFDELKALTEFHKPDLVIINPVYIFAEGDIGRSEFAQPFIANLDYINRAERFAYILVHHTGKPAAKQNNGKRAEADDWESVYMGFGSSYFANWPRCSALLEPRPNAPGRFVLRLGKGRYDAGVTKEVQQGAGTRAEAVTKIPIRHSTETMPVGKTEKPLVHWEVDTGLAPEEEPDKPQKRERQTHTESDTATVMAFVPGPSQSPKSVSQILKFVSGVSSLKIKPVMAILNQSHADGFVERILDQNLGVCYRKRL